MKLALTVGRQALLIAVPVVSSWAVISVPAQADTSSSSVFNTTVDEFSQPAFDLDSLTDSDTFTFAIGSGLVNANADAKANVLSTSWSGFSSAKTDGTGFSYEGLAVGQSSLLGTFLVHPGQAFSFNFSSQLDLAAEITKPLVEFAAAFGEIRFELYDDATDQLVDSFGLFGLLTPTTSASPFKIQTSDYVTLTNGSNSFTSSSNSASASSTFSGVYNRTFDGSLNLRLESFQANASTVEAVPEPDYIVSSIALLLMVPVVRYWRRKRADVAD